MKILFICKHNVFRSKVAEAYFKKINKNKNIEVSSAGIVKPNMLSLKQIRLIKLQRKTARGFGIKYRWSPKMLSVNLIRKQDLIIITADDVCEEIFENSTYGKKNLKVIVWKIQDVQGKGKDEIIIRNSIKKIMENVEKLSRKLE